MPGDQDVAIRASRGDPDCERGGCFLTTPEACLVPRSKSSSPRADITASQHIICRVSGSLRSALQPCLHKTFLSDLKDRGIRTRPEADLRDLVFPFTSLTSLGW